MPRLLIFCALITLVTIFLSELIHLKLCQLQVSRALLFWQVDLKEPITFIILFSPGLFHYFLGFFSWTFYIINLLKENEAKILFVYDKFKLDQKSDCCVSVGDPSPTLGQPFSKVNRSISMTLFVPIWPWGQAWYTIAQLLFNVLITEQWPGPSHDLSVSWGLVNNIGFGCFSYGPRKLLDLATPTE